MPYRLAIFDFDGTLADSFPFFLSVFNTIADRHGFKRIALDQGPDHIEHLRHCSVRQIMAQVGMPAWKLPLASSTFMAMMREQAGSIAPFDGIPDALRHLAAQGVRLAVVSSNAEHNVRTVLGPDLAGLVDRFDCGMSVFGKASRLRAVMKGCGAAPTETIFVGDQGTDLDAARKAGVAFGAVHWGYANIAVLRGEGCTEEFTHPEGLRRLA